MAVKDEHGWISLLPPERTFIQFGVAPPMSTLTWLHAPVDTDKIRDRAAHIILKNPWLAGWFKKDKSGLWGLEYSNIPDLDAAKKILEEKGLFRELVKLDEVQIDPSLHSWTEQDCIIMKAYPDLLLKSNEQFGSPPRLLKISLLPALDGKFVGLAFSLSHCICDGHTYYKLYESLLTDKDSSLRVQRNMDTMAEQERVLGKANMDLMTRIDFVLLVVLNCICDYFLGWLCPNQFSTVPKTYILDKDKISKLKKQTKLPFVSTNDIVTSWFLSNASYGSMAFNLRGRLPGHTDDMAGNYESILHYRCTDAATPDLIRQSLKACKRVVTPSQRLTGFEMMRKWKTHFITNWASLYPNSIETLGVYKTHSHGPFGNAASVLPSHIASSVLYQSSPTELSMNIWASPNAHKTMDPSMIVIDDEHVTKKDL